MAGGKNPFKKLLDMPPSFSFSGLSFVETPRFPRELYRGQGAEKIFLPRSDKEKNTSYFIIADSSGEPVGAIVLSMAKRTATRLFILPEARGKGYGLSAIGALEDYARKNGWPEIKTHVPADRVATLGILEELGWARSGPHTVGSGQQFYILKKSFR